MLLPTVSAVIMLTVLGLFISFDTNSMCTVKIGNSEFIGKSRKTWNGKEFCSFFGVPYTEKPKRFKLSTLNDVSWTGVQNFTTRKEKCLQFEYKTSSLVGKEDCLYLDIHTELKSSKSPVLVWFHGGSFYFGAGEEDIVRPDNLIDRGIVVVTVNYRLGPLGFFSYPNEQFSKNLGLKDQINSLKWTKKYISNFGGNNLDVTISGWSAGSAAVTYHLFSIQSSGLFEKAIAMSGTFLNTWAINMQSNLSSIAWCKYANINCDDPNALQQLQEVSLTTELYNIHDPNVIFFNMPYPSFIPIADYNEDGGEIISEEPHKLIFEKPKNDVPLLIGYTNLEETCDFFYTNEYQTENFRFPYNRIEVEEFLGKLLNSEEPDKEKHEKYIHLRRIADMIYGVREYVEKYVKDSKSPVFMYEFSLARKIKENESRCSVEFENGAFHGDDIILLFGKYFKVWETFQRNTEKPKKNMLDLLANFIHYGDPTPDKISTKTSTPKWPSYKENKLIMNFNETMSIQPQETSELYMLWSSIYNCLYYNKCNSFLEYSLKY